MNPYQVMGIIACCTIVFAGLVTFFTMLGVPLVAAFIGVYLLAIWFMVGTQRRAKELYDGQAHSAQRRYDRETAVRRVRINDQPECETQAGVLGTDVQGSDVQGSDVQGSDVQGSDVQTASARLKVQAKPEVQSGAQAIDQRQLPA